MHGSWRAEVDLKGAILQRLHENDALGRADVGRARRDEAMDAGYRRPRGDSLRRDVLRRHVLDKSRVGTRHLERIKLRANIWRKVIGNGEVEEFHGCGRILENVFEKILSVVRAACRKAFSVPQPGTPRVPAVADTEVGPPDSRLSIPHSQLAQWPCQIRLVPVKAPFFQGAKLLIAADCTAYAYANFHQEFMRGKVTIVGCPKLDPVDYSEKLTEILHENDIKSVTIVRMEVPCCCGLEMAAKKALQESGKFIPWQVVTLSLDGKIIDS